MHRFCLKGFFGTRLVVLLFGETPTKRLPVGTLGETILVHSSCIDAKSTINLGPRLHGHHDFGV